MKKIAIIVAVLSLVTVFACSAQTVIYYDTPPTVAFLSDMFDVNGVQIDPNLTVEHEIYLSDDSLEDDFILIGNTNNLELLLTIPYDGYWSIGMRAKVTNKYNEISYSDMSYSTVAGDTANNTAFVIAPRSMEMVKPNKPTMIMIK